MGSKSKDENKNNDSSILPSIDLTKDEEELPQSKKPKFGQQVLPTGLLAAMGNTKLKSADTGPSLFDSEEPDDSFLSTSSSTSTKNNESSSLFDADDNSLFTSLSPNDKKEETKTIEK